MTKSNVKKFNLTFTQCKQLVSNDVDLHNLLERLNDQPDFMAGCMSIDEVSEIMAINQGGCAGNAHRSVFYFEANKVMAEHGDDVLEFIEENTGELPAISNTSWSEMGSLYLSCAVELWCNNFADDFDGEVEVILMLREPH